MQTFLPYRIGFVHPQTQQPVYLNKVITMDEQTGEKEISFDMATQDKGFGETYASMTQARRARDKVHVHLTQEVYDQLRSQPEGNGLPTDCAELRKMVTIFDRNKEMTALPELKTVKATAPGIN